MIHELAKSGKIIRKKEYAGLNSAYSGPVEVLQFFKNNHISDYTQPTYLIFGTVKDTVSIFYSTTNQGHGCCVGGDKVIFEKLENFYWTGIC